MSEYYNWQKTLSYNADITMVIAARGIGKTYGLRKQCIKDFVNRGKTFVEVTRYREELQALQRNYFDRIAHEFPEYAFKVETNCGYIAVKTTNEKNYDWKLCCYFLAMTSFQMIKKMTFNNVKRIIMDECIIERNDVYHRYLPNEWQILTNIVDTVTREHSDDKDKAKLYLLGNACDIINPYFEYMRVNGMPDNGYTWYNNKHVLLHYPKNVSYAEDKKNTLAGQMSLGTENESVALENIFVNNELDLIRDKSSCSVYVCTLFYNNKELAIWVDNSEGYYYCNQFTPKNSTTCFALTIDDNANYQVLRKRMPLLRTIADAYRMRVMWFDTPRTHGVFKDIMSFIGEA